MHQPTAKDLLSEFGEFTQSLGISAGDSVLTKALTTAARGIVNRSVITKTPGPHSYASAQFNLEGDLRDKVLDLIDQIPDEYLGADGKETTPHITVKYGLHTDDASEAVRLVRGFGPVEVYLGRVVCFCANDSDSQRGGSTSDVIVIEVESDSLIELNSIVGELPHSDTFPIYKPHITLAYVQAGMGERIIEGLSDLEGEEAEFDTIEFSPASGEDKAQISLTRRKLVEKSLDKHGGEVPTLSRIALSRADFVTLPPNVHGTNCGNCTYGHSNICRHPQLRGQPINSRNCCSYWDAPNTLRPWRSGAYNEDVAARENTQNTKSTRDRGCIQNGVGEHYFGVESSYGSGIYLVEKGRGSACKPSERADLTGCIPARGPAQSALNKPRTKPNNIIDVPAAHQEWVPKGHAASPEEYARIKRAAQEKIDNDPLPSREAVEKARAELEKAKQGLARPGGENRGGPAAARRRQREVLFEQFAGKDGSYAICHNCGRKIHKDINNPGGYMRMERGKIFVKCQGGGYQIPNLLPECVVCNRSRNDARIKRGNDEGCRE